MVYAAQSLAWPGRVLLLIGAANRDPRVFPDPDRYDMGCDTRPMTSFGKGPRSCLGAQLARLEARVVLRELVALVSEDYGIDAGLARPLFATVHGFARLSTIIMPRRDH
ncbi:hypothetical protein GCM10010411_75980 [Actinomadura fulvescens]|uniref:Cytochrome P450 n=1 Tax=Actinomadura fulvescens TaxID=46160 RepID=A0ABP6CVQ6_9ACTN